MVYLKTILRYTWELLKSSRKLLLDLFAGCFLYIYINSFCCFRHEIRLNYRFVADGEVHIRDHAPEQQRAKPAHNGGPSGGRAAGLRRRETEPATGHTTASAHRNLVT